MGIFTPGPRQKGLLDIDQEGFNIIAELINYRLNEENLYVILASSTQLAKAHQSQNSLPYQCNDPSDQSLPWKRKALKMNAAF